MRSLATMILIIPVLAACGTDTDEVVPRTPIEGDGSRIIDLLGDGELVYGVFVPNENGFTAEAAAELGRNEYLDFLFLDLESNPYDINAVHAFVDGLSIVDADDRPTLLVRLPTIESAGYELTKERTQEALNAGADGLVYPHIMSVEMATRVKSFWEDLGTDVWSSDNPNGGIVMMLMLEDREAIEVAADVADLGGYSMLSCGIGSLTQDLGSAEAGEAGCLTVLEHGSRVGLPHIQLAFDRETLRRRIDQGFQGFLMQMNDDMPDIVRAGWAETGRD